MIMYLSLSIHVYIYIYIRIHVSYIAQEGFCNLSFRAGRTLPAKWWAPAVISNYYIMKPLTLTIVSNFILLYHQHIGLLLII